MDPVTRRTARILLAYNGGSFHGFAPSPGVRTVADVLSSAMELILRVPVALVGAGRTDTGVHGWGQVVSVDLDASTDLARLSMRINKFCGPEISIREIAWAEPGFHARFSATARHYRYHIWNDPSPHPLAADRAWHVRNPLALWALQAAGDPFLGQHDFSTFCRRPPDHPDGQPVSLVRNVTQVRWTRLGDTPMLRLEISATAFCHQMVRSLVGTMVEVGLHKRSVADVVRLLRARDRSQMRTVAPPHGLVLHRVSYDGVRWDAEGDSRIN
jgi:tRNA pseudouridine38-40 synthase